MQHAASVLVPKKKQTHRLLDGNLVQHLVRLRAVCVEDQVLVQGHCHLYAPVIPQV